jgi:hypothetical protein
MHPASGRLRGRGVRRGFHIMALRVGAAVCLLLAVTANPVHAQSDTIIRPPILGSWMDNRMVKTFAEGKVGAIAMAAEVGPGRRCEQLDIDIGRVVDGKWRSTPIRAQAWVFETMTYGGMTTIVPGEFSVMSVSCKFGNNTTRLNGPYAKFQVRLGEVANLGVLRLDYKTEGVFVVTGKLKKSIAGMKPEMRAKMKEEFPHMFPKAVARHMTMVGPVEVDIKKR